MNAEEQAVRVKEWQQTEAAIADNRLLIAQAIRANRAYAEAPSFFDQVMDMVENMSCSVGSFSQSAKLENGKTVKYSFAWCTGMRHLGEKKKYQETFGKPVPGWVLSLHPEQIIYICDLAVKQHRMLPELWKEELTSEHAESLRGLRREVNSFMAEEIRKYENKDWLSSLAAQEASAFSEWQAAHPGIDWAAMVQGQDSLIRHANGG